jgi:IPT/TIG domain
VTEGSGSTVLTVKGKGVWPFHRVYLDGHPLATRYVSNTELQATVPAELVASVGTYVVTVRADGEPLAESHRAHLVVGFRE